MPVTGGSGTDDPFGLDNATQPVTTPARMMFAAGSCPLEIARALKIHPGFVAEDLAELNDQKLLAGTRALLRRMLSPRGGRR